MSKNEVVNAEGYPSMPTSDTALAALVDLKIALQVIQTMINNDNEKPFDLKNTKMLKSCFYDATFKLAFLSVVYNKIKNILEINKSKFTTNFKMEINDFSIIIYADCGIYLKAFEFNFEYEEPYLISTIYDIEGIKNDLDSTISILIDKENFKDELEKSFFEEKGILGKMKQNPVNSNFMYIEAPNELYEDFDFIETTPLNEQSKKINSIAKKIEHNNRMIQFFLEIKNKNANLLEVLSNINLDDFVKLREIIESSLGIMVKEEDVRPFHTPEENIIDIQTYSIGDERYGFKYQLKKKRPSLGGNNDN